MIDGPVRMGEKESRTFGLVLGGLLAGAAFLCWRKGVSAWPALALAGGLSALVAGVSPASLIPVLKVWMRAAGVVAAVNTAVLMTLLWAVVFVPWGLFRFLARIELLDLRFRDAKSYWRDHAQRPKESYKRLF